MKKILFFILSFILVSQLKSQSDTSVIENKDTTTFIFYIDGYTRHEFDIHEINNRTSFTNSNNHLELGMASVRVDKTHGKFYGLLDLGFGRRARDFSYNDNGFLTIVKQAQISYSPNDRIKLSIGKWGTHIGYEMLDAYLNKNYSMSYGFSYGPFFHAGLKADIALSETSSAMVGITEPTDFDVVSLPFKMFIAQYTKSTKDGKLKGALNYQGGKSKSQFDLVMNAQVLPYFGINYDGTICNLSGKTWTSNAVYLNYDPNSVVGFGLRVEEFTDNKMALGIGTSILQSTLSANIHLGKFTLIPELRIDEAKKAIFLNAFDVAKHSSVSVLFASIYKF